MSRIVISTRAEKRLRKLPKFDQLAVAKKIRLLTNGKILGEEKISGYKNIFRVRVGNYRIVYRKTSKEIFIFLIDHRKEIYQLLKRLFE